MRTSNILFILLSLICCLRTATAQQATLSNKVTKTVKEQHFDHEASFSVLKDAPQTKHGKYTMKGQNWRGEGAYANGQKTGVWSFYNSQNVLESQYDFTNLIQTYERSALSVNTENFVFVDGAYQKTKVDSEAMLLGGEVRLMSFLSKNVKYPAAAQRAGEQGIVVLAIELSEHGQVIGATVKNSATQELDEEAMRVFKLLPDDWVPAVVDGKPVRSLYYLPIRFSIR